jgi:hypothetical protein
MNSETINIPTPTPSEVLIEESQKPSLPEESQKLIRLPSTGALAELPMTGTLKEMLECNVRGQGAVGMLFYANFHRLESEVSELKKQLSQSAKDLADLREKYSAEKTSVAVLEQKFDASAKLSIAEKWFLTLGGLVAGIGGPILIDKGTSFGLVTTLFGLVLLFCGWFSPKIKK